MFTEKNFKNALEVMSFEKISDGIYQKNFSENIFMKADFHSKKLFYPKNLKIYRDNLKNFSQNENFVVFECVHRLLQKGYQPDDIEIEKFWNLGHTQKSGRTDICISKNKNFYEGNIAWITTVALGKNFIDENDVTKFISADAMKNSSTHLIPKNTLLFGLRVGVGKSSITKISMFTNQDIVALLDIDEKIFDKLYIKICLDSYKNYFDEIKKGNLKKILIPVPPRNLQEKNFGR